MNIFVRNLSVLVTEEKLRTTFRPFGQVKSTSIVTDKETGRSVGIGFVEMPNRADAIAAIKALHHAKLFSLKMRVKEANPKFGQGYFAENTELQTAIVKPETGSSEDKPFNRRKKSEYKPGVEGAFGKRKGMRRNTSVPVRVSPSEGGKPGYKPRGERSFTPRGAGERGSRPYSSSQSRKGGKPSYKPSGGRPRKSRATSKKTVKPFARFRN